jgi:hypothetical protein
MSKSSRPSRPRTQLVALSEHERALMFFYRMIGRSSLRRFVDSFLWHLHATSQPDRARGRAVHAALHALRLQKVRASRLWAFEKGGA